MRKELRRPFPKNRTGRAGEAASTHARGGRLCAPPCRFHEGSGGGPGARIALLPVPDAEFAEVRRPPFPRPGNPPRAPNAFAAPAEIQGAEWASGRSAIGGSNGRQGRRVRRPRSSGCDRPRLRMPMRMRGTRRARYLQTLLQPYSYAAYLTQIFSTAAIFLRRICYCRICLCSYYVGHNATAAYLLHIMTTVDITTAEYSYAAILTSHTHNVLPTHLIPASLKVSHRSSPLPPSRNIQSNRPPPPLLASE